MDLFADETLFHTGEAMERLCAIASEESEHGQLMNAGKYALVFDPLDGSANSNANVGIGTIFGIYGKISGSTGGSMEDILQCGYS